MSLGKLEASLGPVPLTKISKEDWKREHIGGLHANDWRHRRGAPNPGRDRSGEIQEEEKEPPSRNDVTRQTAALVPGAYLPEDHTKRPNNPS
ncbi:hypothetical protein RHMOL_Rhmol05G0008700 [Rhododendron molle]|uniref:Uncharacterized protein n=1 Tax=Rhododendron molle TaxID=49168 RepID=A0ACC0NJF6_RHOML|nr:hypothetical protein RHMOL_Rhmol05G0008700 [Rhododendron molle]